MGRSLFTFVGPHNGGFPVVEVLKDGGKAQISLHVLVLISKQAFQTILFETQVSNSFLKGKKKSQWKSESLRICQ